MKMAFSKNKLILFNLFIMVFFLLTFVNAQNPTTEFEISSILVDGCDGGNEGKNEMVIFQNGPNPLDINNIRVDGAGATGIVQIGKWPNNGNSFLGFCTTLGATSNIATLNSAITQCGKLIEPVGGIIPKYGKILIITSTDFTASPTYFSNLTDTLYVVFQCAGNTAGHFVNYNSTSSSRTLILTNTISGYRDTISYDPSLLLNSSGNPGSGDGGAVRYDWNGNATYFNNGCQAPFIPLSINTDPIGVIDCSSNSYNLTGNILSGSYKKIFWDGGIGTFSNSLALSTTYTPGAGELGLITLRFNAIDICNDTIRSLVNLTIYPQPISNAGNDTTLCSSIPGSIGSTPIIGSTYSWNPAIGLSSSTAAQPSITLLNTSNLPITTSYILTTTISGTGCTMNDTVEIIINPLDNANFSLSSNCNGAIANLSGLVGGTFTFSTIPSDGATLNSLNGTITSGVNGTTYSVTYTTSGICPNTQTQTVILPIRDDASFITSPNCFGGTSNIIGTSNGIFSFTSVPSDNATINSTTGELSNGTPEQTYYITYTTNGTCIDSNNDSIKVLKKPDAPIFQSYAEICLSENLPYILPYTTLTDTTNWYSDINLTNLISSNDSIQLFNQIGATNYYATSILNGCESLPTLISVTINDCTIDIPTAFTPDGDLVNDKWELINIDYLYPNNTVKVFNRWGYVLFESPIGKYESNSWDGNFNGETMPVGSYYFIIEFNKEDKKAESGTISIIR